MLECCCVFQAPTNHQHQDESSRRGSLLSADAQRARTASTSSNASSASTASTSSSSSHENELLSAMQSQEPQVMDIAASHLPDSEPYVELPKPVEDVQTKPQTKLSMMKFVAASKETGRTSSIDDVSMSDPPKIEVDTRKFEATEVLDSGKVAEVIDNGKVGVIDSGTVVESGKVGVLEKVIDSGKVMRPPAPVPIVIEPPPKPEKRPIVDEEERLRKQRETEKVTACTFALLLSMSVRSS